MLVPHPSLLLSAEWSSDTHLCYDPRPHWRLESRLSRKAAKRHAPAFVSPEGDDNVTASAELRERGDSKSEDHKYLSYVPQRPSAAQICS